MITKPLIAGAIALAGLAVMAGMAIVGTPTEGIVAAGGVTTACVTAVLAKSPVARSTQSFLARAIGNYKNEGHHESQ